jgi:hypothetical protein
MSKNPYAYGFWCLALVISVVGVAALLSSAYGNSPNYAAFHSGLSAWAGLAQAIAATVLVVAAFLGVNEWKKQLRHEKELNVVWETLAAVRRLEMSFNNLRAHLLVYTSDRDFNLSGFLLEHPIVGYLKSLEEHCLWMDRLFSENDWKWVSRASSFNMHVSSYRLLYSNTPALGSIQFVAAMASRSDTLETISREFQDSIIAMDRELLLIKRSLS